MIFIDVHKNNSAHKSALTKTHLSLYLLNYAKACNELARPISASLHLRAIQLLSKKCRSGGEPLTILFDFPICLARDLNLRPPALQTNALPQDQLVIFHKNTTKEAKSLNTSVFVIYLIAPFVTKNYWQYSPSIHLSQMCNLQFEHNLQFEVISSFTKLPWSGDSERTSWSSSQAATSPVPTCLPHAVEASHCSFY